MQESDVELKKDQTCGVCENVQSSQTIHLPLGATQGMRSKRQKYIPLLFTLHSMVPRAHKPSSLN